MFEFFNILVLLLDKIVLGVYPDLYFVLSVSVLLFLVVSTVSLNVCYFSVLSTVSIFIFAHIGDVLDSLTTSFLDFPSLSTVSISIYFGVIDAPYLSFLCLF